MAEQAEAAAKDAATEAADAARRVVEKASKQQVFANLTTGYQIDVRVAPVPPALNAQLKLDGKGLVVEGVEEAGPAAAAGIQSHDILISVNDKSIDGAKDLMKSLQDSQGKPLTIKLLRAGEPQEVTVTPKQRSSVTADLRFPTEEVEVEIHKLESKIREKLKDAGLDVRMQLLRPAHVLPPGARFSVVSDIPDDVTIMIEKKGDSAAKITIKKGDETWAATEVDLDKLPAEVRPHVERMLGKIPAPFAIAAPHGGPVTMPMPPRAVRDIVVVEEAREEVRKRARQARERAEEVVREKVRPALERRLEHMSRDMERLSQQMEQLRHELQNFSEDEEEVEESKKVTAPASADEQEEEESREP